LFYMVAASYITIYLAIIFLIIANTIIGVQFLISQQKAGKRYRTLIHLGAEYATICKSSGKQINWYFGIPTAVAAFSSLFGVRALFTGIVSSRARSNLNEMMIVSAAMILALCVIECIYIAVVKRSSDRYLLTLMVPEREE
ncbi:MAG: ABC transporter permease, partial [Lachnospiraceae bacterium]|nr:ABC transporter permease [Lachnospiraceae bacterium]